MQVIFLLFYFGTGLSYSMDLLSLRLVGVVGARDYAGNSFSQWQLSMTRI